jgi:tRNA-dihydrouridine synthase B
MCGHMIPLFPTTDFSVGSLHLKNRVILAPLAGITDRVFRQICRQHGTSLCITEMVSADGLVRHNRKTYNMITISPDDHPLGIQIFGSNPEILSQAARMVEDVGADVVDLNVGCPVRKVVKRGAGAALLGNLDLLTQIIHRVVSAVHIPVTIKIRSGIHSNKPVFIEVGKIAEQEGISAIALHPRSLSQVFTGKANWNHIAELAASVKIPVIGSGDIFTVNDAIRMVQETNCQAVMVARGALGNPHLFRQITAAFQNESIPPDLSPVERLNALLNHYNLALSEYGACNAVYRMRAPINWYIRGMSGASHLRQTLMCITNPDEVLNLIRNFRDQVTPS